MKEKHLVLFCTILNAATHIRASFIIDFDATDKVFINSFFAQFYVLSLTSLLISCIVIVIHDWVFFSNAITYVVNASFLIETHFKKISMFVIKLSHYLIILSISWLNSHNFCIDWSVSTVVFDSNSCSTHCRFFNLREHIVTYDIFVISKHLLFYRCLALLKSSLLKESKTQKSIVLALSKLSKFIIIQSNLLKITNVVLKIIKFLSVFLLNISMIVWSFCKEVFYKSVYNLIKRYWKNFNHVTLLSTKVDAKHSNNVHSSNNVFYFNKFTIFSTKVLFSYSIFKIMTYLLIFFWADFSINLKSFLLTLSHLI